MNKRNEDLKDLNIKMGETIIQDMVNDSIDLDSSDRPEPIYDENPLDTNTDEYEYEEGITPIYGDDYDGDDSNDKIKYLYKNIYSVKHDDGYRLFDSKSMTELTDSSYMYIKRIEGTTIAVLGTFEGLNSNSIFSIREKTAPCKLFNLDTKKFITESITGDISPLNSSTVIVSNENKQRLLNTNTGVYIGGEERVFQSIKQLGNNMYLVALNEESYHIYDADNDSLILVESKDKLIKIISNKEPECNEDSTIESIKSPTVKCGNTIKPTGYRADQIYFDEGSTDSSSLIVTKYASIEKILDCDILNIIPMRGYIAKIQLVDNSWILFDVESSCKLNLEEYGHICNIKELDKLLYIIDTVDNKFLIKFTKNDDNDELYLSESVKLIQ